jgi:tetratricopeptide (TPR) repeat protein
MRLPILSVFVLVFYLAPWARSAEEANYAAANQSETAVPEPAPQAPLTPRDRDELQARTYMAKKQYSEAAEAYTRLSHKDPGNPSYLNFIGIALLQVGKISDARKYFERTTKLNERFAEGYNNLGTTYFAENQYEKAVSEYRKALAIEPNSASINANLGYAYFAQNQFPQALQAFEKALSIDPNGFDATGSGSMMSYHSTPWLFNFMMAKLYAQNGDAANCAIHLRHAVEGGYKDVFKVRKDPVFAKVLDDPNVKAVLDEAAVQQSSAPKNRP